MILGLSAVGYLGIQYIKLNESSFQQKEEKKPVESISDNTLTIQSNPSLLVDENLCEMTLEEKMLLEDCLEF